MAAVNSLKVFAIANRTDSAGTTQVDTDWEELRLGGATSMLRGGLLPNLLDMTPNSNGFRVRQNTGADMNVKVGSGTTQRDGYVLRGTVAGQGAYVLRLDSAGLVVSAPATDASLPCRYGVYAWIDDANYAGTASRAYAGVSCLRGAPNASPTTPAASAVWSASVLLWEFQLPALATAVTDAILDSATSFDRRTTADLLPQNVLENQVFG
jgi:hypothetical protein